MTRSRRRRLAAGSSTALALTVAWLGPFAAEARAQGRRGPEDAQIESPDMPKTIAAGQTVRVKVVAKNTGMMPWAKARNHNLLIGAAGVPLEEGQSLYRIVPLRTHLPDNVQVGPGDTHTYTFEIKAPRTPQTLKLQISMHREWGGRFGNVLEPTIVVCEDALEAGMPPPEEPGSIRLLGGERLKGELVAGPPWRVATRYGEVVVQPEQVVQACLSDEGDRLQLASGDVVAGRLAVESFGVRLASGETVQVRRADVAIVATSGAALPERRAADLLGRGAALATQDGGRWLGEVELDRFSLETAIGRLVLPRSSIQSIRLGQSTPRDRVTLLNGDVLSGVLLDEAVSVKLRVGPRLSFPKASLVSVLLAPTPEDDGLPSAPEEQRVRLQTGDALSVRFREKALRFAARVGTVELDLALLSRLESTGKGRFRAVLRDGCVLHGRPVQDPLVVGLEAGGEARIAVDRIALLESWRLGEELAARIAALVKQLDADSSQEREAATNELVGIGRLAIAPLSKARRDGSPETRKNAESALERLKAAPGGGADEKPEQR